MKTAVIGDVHGCIAELNNLLDVLIKAHKVQHFVSAGDLLDKGPDSPAVIQRMRKLSEHYKVSLVLGNHEENHERFRAHIEKGQGYEKNMKNYEELLAITKALSSKDIAFIESATLYFRLPQHNVIVVHAGIPPSIVILPSHDNIKAMANKKRKHYKQMLRVRYVNPNGYMVHLGSETKKDTYWADIYDGRFGTVLFGHQPFMQSSPKYFKHAIGLDLGCVFGGKLCAYVFDGEKTFPVTVDGQQYAEPYYLHSIKKNIK